MRLDSTVPAIRVATQNERPVRPEGEYVLLWMIGARRTRWNFALDRAIGWARELDRPLVVVEPLRVDYPYASDRFHHYVIDGMADHARAFAHESVTYVPWVERLAGDGRGMLEAYAQHACVVVTDDTPIPFLRGMVRAAAGRVQVRLEAIDSVGLLPLRAAPQVFGYAHAFRRFLQKTLPTHLGHAPAAVPFDGVTLPRLAALPDAVSARWPGLSPNALENPSSWVGSLPLDHSVTALRERGGDEAARAQLTRFVRTGLLRYGDRSHPDLDAQSGLSGWLHFGHLSAHEVFGAIADHAGWTPARLAAKPTGSRDGWWNVGPEADGFLDELVTWRELGHVRAHLTDDGARYEGVAGWARASLEEHASDPRPELYDLTTLERAGTSDPVWNAAQRQLRAEGRIHNYLRMLWGKKVLAWSPHPAEAFERLVYLNDKYAIDGRDPNSYSGIGWVFGSYDRPWAPQRPVYGQIRYMTSDSAQKKLKMKAYLARWSRP